MVPVGDLLKQKAVLLREDFSSEEIREAYQAWNFIDRALQSEADTSILKRCKPPKEAFDHLEKRYVQRVRWRLKSYIYDKFHDFTVPPNSNPIEALHALKNTNDQMDEKGVGISDIFLLCSRAAC